MTVLIGSDWRATVGHREPDVTDEHGRFDTGAGMLLRGLQISDAWRSLTKPQRELLASTYYDMPVKARADVRQRLVDRGLMDKHGYLTRAGRMFYETKVRLGL